MQKREIKFRAWHKAEKKICEVTTINFEDKFAFLVGIKPGEDTYYPDSRMTIIAPKNGRCVSFNEIELMQYTGLHDKNNKEIYEGDIIRCIPKVEFYRVVTFIKSKYWLINNKSNNSDIQFPLEVVYTSHNESEVIGNIYENPELLEDICKK